MAYLQIFRKMNPSPLSYGWMKVRYDGLTRNTQFGKVMHILTVIICVIAVFERKERLLDIGILGNQVIGIWRLGDLGIR